MSGRQNDPTEPPRRLVDQPPGSPTGPGADAWAVDLLRGAEPYRTAVARKQRVQLRLGHASRRRASLALRLAVAAVVLVGGGAFARAALGRWPGWMVRVYERIVAVPAPATPGALARVASSARAAAPTPVPSPAAVAPAPALEPDSAAAPVAVVSPPAARPTRPVATVARQKPSVASAKEDSGPVVEAMRALRRDGDPVRARALLSRYLERYPTGTLAEEALALSIEAAGAHGDPDAAGLAARYLRLYPTGPFRPLARQTLAAAAQQP
jgi:hypothetical protein